MVTFESKVTKNGNLKVSSQLREILGLHSGKRVTVMLVKMGRGIGLKTNHEWNDFDRKQLILSLTSIDGALFMDINGTICGFGIIVDGEAVVKGTTERGARYNSAKNYIANCAKKGIVNIALVVSEDRTVDLLLESDMRNSL